MRSLSEPGYPLHTGCRSLNVAGVRLAERFERGSRAPSWPLLHRTLCALDVASGGSRRLSSGPALGMTAGHR
jgi:hypothetical protein